MNHLIQLEEKLDSIEFSMSREINRNLPAILRGLPVVHRRDGSDIRLYGEGLRSIFEKALKRKKPALGAPLGPPARRKPRKTSRKEDNPPVRKSKRDKNVNYHDGSDRRIDRLGSRGHRKGYVKKKHDRKTIRKEHLEAKLDEAIELSRKSAKTIKDLSQKKISQIKTGELFKALQKIL